MGVALDPPARQAGRARRAASSAAGNAGATERLPVPAGPWKGRRGTPLRGRRAAPSMARACGWCSVPARSIARGRMCRRAARLITVEGIDGAGKSTLAAGLATSLRETSSCCASRAAGAAERLRALVKDPALRSARGPRRCSTRRRAPSSSRRRCDRARGRAARAARPLRRLLARLPGRRPRPRRRCRRAINAFATGGLRARPHAPAALPSGGRPRAPGGRGDAPDRLEQEGDDFFAASARLRPARGGRPERLHVSTRAEAPPGAVLGLLRARAGLAVPVGVGLVQGQCVGEDHLESPSRAPIRAPRGSVRSRRRAARGRRAGPGPRSTGTVAGDAFDRLDHLAHGEARADAEVEDPVRRRMRRVDREHVRVDRGPRRGCSRGRRCRRGSGNRCRRGDCPAGRRGLQDVGDQMGLGLVVLAVAAVAPADVEVAQGDRAEAVGATLSPIIRSTASLEPP